VPRIGLGALRKRRERKLINPRHLLSMTVCQAPILNIFLDPLPGISTIVIPILQMRKPRFRKDKTNEKLPEDTHLESGVIRGISHSLRVLSLPRKQVAPASALFLQPPLLKYTHRSTPPTSQLRPQGGWLLLSLSLFLYQGVPSPDGDLGMTSGSLERWQANSPAVLNPGT
jgi:hypothetical protein